MGPTTPPPPPRHTLDAVLRPRSVAVVGASTDPTRIGGRPLRYLREAGFVGPVYPVNPRHRTVQGLAAYPRIDDLPEPVDLAVIAVPAPHVLATAEACAARGTRAAVIFSAGFAEVGGEGRVWQEGLTALTARRGMRIVGPNCLGVYNALLGFFATFTTTLEAGFPTPGPVGVVSQSGAYGSHLSLLAHRRRVGIRYWITTGNEADVAVPEAIEWLAAQPDVSVIMAYAEGIADRDTLVRALELARVRRVCVVFLKVGSTAVGAEAARAHTAALAGADAVYDAAFRQFGAYRARGTEEMLDVAYAAALGRFPPSRRIALVSISGGVGVQMADAAVELGLDVAPMSDAAQARLKTALPFASARNPIDITAQAFNRVELVAENLEIVLADGRYDALVAFFTYVAAADAMVGPIRRALEAAATGYPDRVLVLGIVGPDDVVRQYEAAGCLVFEDPTRAVRAVAALCRFAELFARPPAAAAAVTPPATLLPTGPIGEQAAKRILAAAGLPMLDDRLATTADETARVAAEIGWPVAVKVASPDVAHKSDRGGVVLDVRSPEAARRAFDTVVGRLRATDPAARVEGVLVAAMVTGGVEVILGAHRDPTFGPVVMFGLGGVFAETLGDVAFRVAPFDTDEAHRMMRETKGYALLAGARGRPRCDVDAVATALASLSRFAAAHAAQLESAEINPLVVLRAGEGAQGVDAVLRARASSPW